MVSDIQKRARNKWDAANMAVLGCKIRKDKADLFKAECKAAGTTPNAVFTSAIDNFMTERASDLEPVVTPQNTSNQEERILSPETLEAAQLGVQSTGETIPEFLSRAVNDTLKRDRAVLLLGMNPAGKSMMERGSQAPASTETAPMGDIGGDNGGGLAH